MALDRYARIHSTFPPPSEVGKQQSEKGIVLEKMYMTALPTVVVWDQRTEKSTDGDGEEDDEEIWEKMKHADEKEGE